MKAFLITLVILLIGIGGIGVMWWLIRRGSARLSGGSSAPVSPAVSPSPAPPQAEPEAPAAREAEVAAEPAATSEPAAEPEPAASTPAASSESARQATAVEEAVPAGPYGPASATPLPDGSAPSAEFTVKGNGGSMLYHAPESPYFTRTKAEAWFRTAEDAEAAGFQHWNSRRRKK